MQFVKAKSLLCDKLSSNYFVSMEYSDSQPVVPYLVVSPV